jgi:hypothetical protein
MSRFRHRDRRTRIPKQSRTIPVRGHKDYGDGQDDGKYWRCWNCGFICDVERDELGDSESTDGVSHRIYDALYTGGEDMNETDAMIHGDNNGVALLTMASARSGHVLLELDAAGDPMGVRLNWTPEIASGCPFCGTRNWRGDY